jgi:glycosyltransferase involved in cell wall biosynthesis
MTAEAAPLRPRVCLIGETYYPVIGGGETQARALAAGLGEFGCDMRVVTRRSDPAFLARETIDGVPVRRIGPTGPGHLKKWAMLPTLFVELLRSRRDYDILLVCGFRVLGLAAMAAGLLLGKPVALKADNSGEMSGAYFTAGAAKLGLDRARGAVALLLRLRNRLFRRADVFICLSSEMRAEFAAHGAPPDRIVMIPNSVDPARFRRAPGGPTAAGRAVVGLPPDGPVVVFAGRLLATKGVMELLAAWATLSAEHPAARLVIVGAGGGLMHDCEAQIHAFIEANGLRGSVVTTGFVRNVEDYLKAGDIFAFPTMDEAFGIALIEAMAAGLAVTASAVGGIPDIVTPEVDGLLVPPADVAALTSALGRLLADAALRGRLGAAAAETVERRYRTDAVLARYADLLARIARSPEAASAAAPHGRGETGAV